MSIGEREASPVYASFDMDLENARVLIEDHPWKENPQKYRKVAEGIVRRVLTFDPQNTTAKRLLAKIEVPLPIPKTEKALVLPKKLVVSKEEVPLPEAPPPPRLAPAPDLSFAVPNFDYSAQTGQARRPPWILMILATVGILGGLALLITRRDTFTTPQYWPKQPMTSPAVVQASTTVSAAQAAAAPESTVVPALPASPVASVSPAPAPSVDTLPPAAPVIVKSSVAPIAPIQTGTLAVSSPATVDIYNGDQLVGSAPATLVLPAGNQTLEYRHQEMSKRVTHVIKANETTTATVTFDIVVQINARPWAQVFLDGAQRRPLGQTPLSNIIVPIGGVLSFENPNFPAKTYRINGRETEIRVSFP